MTHTPGPWTIDVDHVEGYIVFLGANGESVCAMAWSTDADYEPTETDKADARLIAAAPSLLAALEEALAEMETIDGNLADGRETYVSSGRIEQARTAIAAARGEEVQS